MKDILSELQERGLVAQVSSPDLQGHFQAAPVRFYIGFDPTARSLHLGHLIPLICSRHLQLAGHQPILLVGGATAMVGDPSGKSLERNLLGDAQVEENVRCVRRQIERFVSFEGPGAAEIVNNADWIKPFSFVDWLRDVGKFFTVNYMLAKDSVQNRLRSEDGISFTKFSYMTMQAFDFLHLFRERGCTLQCGGNDQWGNMTAGTELIRKVLGREAFALTFPLILTSSGEKFGKSAGNAVWIDPALTSPYQFFQYLMNTADSDVCRFLFLFTFLEPERVRGIMAEHETQPALRVAQRALATELTRLVHGEEGLQAALAATEVLFGTVSPDALAEADFLAVFRDAPAVSLMRSAFAGQSLGTVLTRSGFLSSKAEARRRIAQGGVYLNNRRQSQMDRLLDESDLTHGKFAILRFGKKDHRLLRITDAA